MKEKILLCINKCIKDQSIETQLDSIIEDMIDSITFVEMIVALEEEFEFEFEDEMLSVSKLKKISDVVNYVEKRLR